jgi:hypothetical protein
LPSTHPIVVHLWSLRAVPGRDAEMGLLLEERPDLKLIAIDADVVANAAELVKAELAKTGLADAENWIFASARLRGDQTPFGAPINALASPSPIIVSAGRGHPTAADGQGHRGPVA